MEITLEPYEILTLFTFVHESVPLMILHQEKPRWRDTAS